MKIIHVHLYMYVHFVFVEGSKADELSLIGFTLVK